MDLKTINQKIKRVKSQLAKERAKLKMLEARKVRLENEQISKVFRQSDITIAELDELLKLRKEGKADAWLSQKISQ